MGYSKVALSFCLDMNAECMNTLGKIYQVYYGWLKSRRALFFRGGENLPNRRTRFIAKYLRSVLSPKSKGVDLLIIIIIIIIQAFASSINETTMKERIVPDPQGL